MRAPLFISHGAPDVLLRDTPAHRAMQALGRTAPPDAYVIVSAHWQSGRTEITASDYPATLHDFRGFERRLATYEYPVPGHSGLASEIRDQLVRAGMEAHLNERRGLDHGAWIPMALIQPAASIPVVQVSLPRQSDAQSVALGRALAPLAARNIQLIGSGALTHSLADSLSMPETAPPAAFAVAFRDHLEADLRAARLDGLLRWRAAPHADRNHPTPEHFRPLLFALAASGGTRGHCLHTSWSRAALAMDIWAFD